MEELKWFHKSIDFKNLTYLFKCENTGIDINDSIDTETLYNKLKSHKIKLDDEEQN